LKKALYSTSPGSAASRVLPVHQPDGRLRNSYPASYIAQRLKKALN
jgi:hypothetical protein